MRGLLGLRDLILTFNRHSHLWSWLRDSFLFVAIHTIMDTTDLYTSSRKVYLLRLDALRADGIYGHHLL